MRPLRILTIGGGPAGLYAALLLKKNQPRHEVTVIERNPAGATFGFGIVLSDRTLSAFREADARSYDAIVAEQVIWDAIDVHYRGQVVRCGGHYYQGIARQRLLEILQERCREVGVEMRFEEEVTDIDQAAAGYDLVIAADGVNSLVRRAWEDRFKPSYRQGALKYMWLGSPWVTGSFNFVFKETEYGMFQAHTYPYTGDASTFVVMCHESTWRRAGLDQMDAEASIRFCEEVFAEELGGRPLWTNRSQWYSFVTVKNEKWHSGRVVLLGDAAHTAHFTIGSGTKLAMEDAIALARAFERHDDIEAALTDYELERRPVVERFQQAARESEIYFENIDRYTRMDPLQFGFQLLTRSTRIDYANLRLRDPYFIDRVDRWYAAAAAGGAPEVLVAGPPMLQPLYLRGLRLANRVVLAVDPPSGAGDAAGMPDPQALQRLQTLAQAGAGLVLAGTAAVSADGRITPADPGIYRPEHRQAWQEAVQALRGRTGAAVGLVLNHAGRRGATRPRSGGLDRPLPPAEAWPLLAPSAIPYTDDAQVPKAMDRDDMDRVREEFAAAAAAAAEAGFDLLMLHMAHGYLLGSFISPLSNQREDEYGGSLEGRMRFPLEVFRAVREAWPEDRPLGVALQVSDWARGGLTLDDAVTAAAMLKAEGCDLIQVLAGQTQADSRPAYGRGFLTPYSERLRHDAGIPTLVGGYLTTTSEINTVVAAGRADLCLLEWAHIGVGV